MPVAPVMAAPVLTPAATRATAYAAEPVAPVAQPVMSTPMSPSVDHSSSSEPFNTLPSGFDISRFGRHTQAAYRGPTPENPFLSLKRRLKRASFFDMRERMAEQGGQPQPSYSQGATPQPAAAAARRQTEYVTTKAPRQPRPGFRPAFQG
jgi:hypothetical protein